MATADPCALPTRPEGCLWLRYTSPGGPGCDRLVLSEQTATKKAGPKRDVRSSVAVNNWWRETD